ncbi:MAG: bifunctional demethylmenaquinone methyltransferase/2-methoxy-6-polyprenyl-1,4-benzoquinol methylase UbiE [Bacteroidota bacterium]
MTVLPYKEDDATKKTQVARMFDSISWRYDLLNHLLSANIDVIWRRKAMRELKALKPKLILDVATGTGDLAIQAIKSLDPDKVIGVDISDGMMDIGRKKIEAKGLGKKIELRRGDSENLPFEENKFDAVTVAFGVRNFENLEKGLAEMLRVLKPGGKVVVLEFSKPDKFPYRQFYGLYFQFVVPVVGRLVSKDKAAYDYLPESVHAFPRGKTFTDILDRLGYKNTTCKPLTFGIASIYTGTK